MKRQQGFYNFDFKAFFIGFAVFGAIVGISVWELVRWAWPYVKAFIHGVTA